MYISDRDSRILIIVFAPGLCRYAWIAVPNNAHTEVAQNEVAARSIDTNISVSKFVEKCVRKAVKSVKAYTTNFGFKICRMKPFASPNGFVFSSVKK